MKTETVNRIATLLRGQKGYFPTLGQWLAMVHEMADIIQDDFDGWPMKPAFIEAINEGEQYESLKVKLPPKRSA